MRVLDLFSGLGGWGAAFRDRGHDVTSIDYEPRFGSSLVLSVMDIKALNGWDVILASPPCETFSVMTIGHYWTGGVGAYEPKNDKSRLGLALMRKAFDLIDKSQPRYYVIENPRGVMRKVAPRPPDFTTWYCRWGKNYAKPTDLWTNLSGDFPACKNNSKDHTPAPRGSRTGVQGVGCSDNEIRHDYQPAGYKAKKAAGVLGNGVQMNASPKLAALRAVIPYPLSLAVCIACETDGVVRPGEMECAA